MVRSKDDRTLHVLLDRLPHDPRGEGLEIGLGELFLAEFIDRLIIWNFDAEAFSQIEQIAVQIFQLGVGLFTLEDVLAHAGQVEL